MSYTRAQIRDLIKQRCDIEGTTAQQDAEINNHINDAAAYTHDFLIATMGESYAYSTYPLTTTANTAFITVVDPLLINPDFYRPVRVGVVLDSIEYPLASYSDSDIIADQVSASWGPGYLPRYKWVFGGSGLIRLWFSPKPDASNIVVNIGFHTNPPVYGSDANVVYLPFPDLLIIEACIRIKDKDQRDSSRFMQERQLIQKRIEDWAGTLDRGNPWVTQVARSRFSRAVWRRDRIF